MLNLRLIGLVKITFHLILKSIRSLKRHNWEMLYQIFQINSYIKIANGTQESQIMHLGVLE